MTGKNSNPVSMRVYTQKSFGEFHTWLKLKYSPGCQVKSIDMPEERAYELYELLREHFNERENYDD